MIDKNPAPPLSDRAVTKLLCGALGTAASFGTDRSALTRAINWLYVNGSSVVEALPTWPAPESLKDTAPRPMTALEVFETLPEVSPGGRVEDEPIFVVLDVEGRGSRLVPIQSLGCDRKDGKTCIIVRLADAEP